MEPNRFNSKGIGNDIYKVWFFAGGETHDNKFNIFTGSFIRLMMNILGDDFGFIRGIYYRSPMRNVIWALNHAQKCVDNPEKNEKFVTAFRQIVDNNNYSDTQLIIISSSTGSVTAAQTACFLAQENINNTYFKKPFHLVLGASMISPESELYKQLIHYQDQGHIGIILNDEVQDDGDTSYGVGGKTRMEAYRNAFGLMFPFFSGKFKGPSFLNTNPSSGHIHRRRSQTLQKAIDYVNIILIQHKLAGNYYKEKATGAILPLNHPGGL
jgi:hypothetical protein